MVQPSTSADGWFHDEWHGHLTHRLGRAVVVSLLLHLGVLMVAGLVRLPQQGERPLASIEISLANLPAPPTKVSEPPKSQQKVVDTPKPAPVKPPPVKAAPAPTPAPAPVPRSVPVPLSVPVPVPVPSKATPIPAPPVPAKLSNDVLRDVMKGVELPPDAPKFGDFSPADKPKKAQLKLPDVPVAPVMKEAATKLPDTPVRSSVTDDLSQELDEEFKKIKKLELPKQTAPIEAPAKPAPQVEAKAPSIKAVDTTLKVLGMAPGSNAYLGRVRQRISSFWSAPPVDVTAQAYVVVVKFRLYRNGTVSDVTVERSSGNEYYDLAGKRAVMSAIPLPAFPSELHETHFDAHFTFTVGERQG